MSRKILTTAAFVAALTACDSTTGPEGAREVTVRFRAATSSQSSALAPSTSRSPAAGASFDHLGGAGDITLVGSNGTLVIQDLRLIVSEIELERVDGACLPASGDDDDCEEFEGGPFLVNLLDASVVDVVSAIVPAGTYTEFEFEAENLEMDSDDDAAERQVKQAILAEIRGTYSAFPDRGSMVMHGTFEGEPFTVYFDAEIEVEREFLTPFRVPEDGAILVELDPAAWFRVGSQVFDPRPFDGQTLDFELEFESGVEVGRGDD